MLESPLLADHRHPRPLTTAPIDAGHHNRRLGPQKYPSPDRLNLQNISLGCSIFQTQMEKLKKPIESFPTSNNPDCKKERSLTSIIDQLLINRSKNTVDTDQSDNISVSTIESNGDTSGQHSTKYYKTATSSYSNSSSDNDDEVGLAAGNSDVEPPRRRRPASWEGSEIEEAGSFDRRHPTPGEEAEDENGKVAENSLSVTRIASDRKAGHSEGRRLRAGHERTSSQQQQRREVKEDREEEGTSAEGPEEEEEKLVVGESVVSPAGQDGPVTGEKRSVAAANSSRVTATTTTAAAGRGQLLPAVALPSEKAVSLGFPVEEARASPPQRASKISSGPSCSSPNYLGRASGKKSSLAAGGGGRDDPEDTRRESSSSATASLLRQPSSGSFSVGRVGGSTPPSFRRGASPSGALRSSRSSRRVAPDQSMPTDTLSVASAAALHEPVPVVKSERFSPEIDSSSSPSVSPHSPSPARGFPSSAAVALGAFGLAVRTHSPAPNNSSSAGLTATIPAFPHQSAAGLDRFSPGSLNPASTATTPAIKQMEMMTRNYSDFMRSLAAKYNNQNSQDNNHGVPLVPTNGLNRSLDSGYPFKTSSARQLGGRSNAEDIPSSGGGGSGRVSKRENQTSPPLLSSQHHPSSPLDPHGGLQSVHHRFSPYNLSDFSSSQTLLNLVRTASAQSASQLENYLRGAATGKRAHEGGVEGRGDPLDLSSKRCRTDFLGADPLAAAAAALHGVGDRLHPASAAGIPFRDLRDLVHHGALKLDPTELLSGPIADLNAALRLSAKRGGSLSNLLDNRLLSNNNNNVNSKSHEHAATARTASSVPSSAGSKATGAKNAEKTTNCLSLCTEQSCTSKSDASEVSHWTVEDVVQFVNTLDCCSEYAEKFQEQSIDGASLCMLSEEHLTSFLGMKLGPALRLKAAIAKKIGHCATCMHCIHCHRDGEAHRTASPLLLAHARHPSPRPQSSSPGSGSASNATSTSQSHGHHSNKESRSSPVSK